MNIFGGGRDRCGCGGPTGGSCRPRCDSGAFGESSDLLFFFLILVVIFCNCGFFDEDSDSLLFFFLLLVLLMNGNGICGCMPKKNVCCSELD